MTRALFRLFCCLIFAVQPAFAQPLPDRAPLIGSALDQAGKPLVGAIVTVRRQESSGAFTFWGAVTASDARGKWRFAQAEAGSYFLSAEMPGFAPISNQAVNWRIGATPLQLRFARLVNLQLKIADSKGVRLADKPLWVRLRGDGEVGQVTRRAVTDEAGNANLEGLLPATYALFIASPGGFAVQNGVDVRNDKTLNVALQRGGALRLTALQDASQSAEAGRKLGGAMLSLTPENIGEATRALGSSADMNENVALLAAGGDARTLVSREADGQILIADVPPGRYLATLRLPGYAVPDPQPVTVIAGQTTDAAFVFTPITSANPSARAALTLQLRVKDISGATLSPAPREWTLRVLPIDKNGALAPEESFMPDGNNSRRALSDQNGQITLFPLKVGRYRVFVAPFLPMTDGSEPEAASTDVDVAPGGTTTTLEVPVVP